MKKPTAKALLFDVLRQMEQELDSKKRYSLRIIGERLLNESKDIKKRQIVHEMQVIDGTALDTANIVAAARERRKKKKK